MHRGGETVHDISTYILMWIEHVRIVAALAHVDMVIGVHGLLGSKLAAKDLDSPIRDNLYVRSSVHFAKSVRYNRPR